MKIKRKEKKQFSQHLAEVMLILFVGLTVASFVCWVLLNRVPIEILEIVATPFGVVISGYFIKAGVENYQKIGSNVMTTESEINITSTEEEKVL